MKNVLLLTARIPYPPDQGDKISFFNLILALSEIGCHVDVLSMSSSDRVSDGRGLKALVRELIVVPLPHKLVRALVGLVTGRSMIFSRFYSRRFARKLVRIHSEYDLIVSNISYMARYFEHIPSSPAVRVNNTSALEHVIYKEQASCPGGAVRKLLVSLDVSRLEREELRAIRGSDWNLCYCEREVRYLHTLGIRNASLMPLGLRAADYVPVPVEQEDPMNFLFMGDYRWFPNYDAAIYVLTDVFPRIRSAMPEARLTLVGRNADSRIVGLSNQANVQYLGEVADLTAVVAKAGFVLGITRVGGGVRLKVLESLARGKIVITNSVSVEGIVDPTATVLSDNPDELPDILKSFISSPGLRSEQKRKAREYFLAYHLADQNAKLLSDLVDRMMHVKRRPGV